MANKQKHAQRSGYSAHNAAPYSMFEQRARVKKAKKEIAKKSLLARLMGGGKHE